MPTRGRRLSVLSRISPVGRRSRDGILDVVVGDYHRGEGHLLNTYSFLFANIVAAYESTGLAIGIEAAADHLGVPEDIVVTGAGVMDGPMDGSDENDIFYRDATDQTARGGEGHDAYVFGLGFGTDVIDDVEPPFSTHKPDLIRFADIASTEVTATRQGQGLDPIMNDLPLAA